MNYPWINPSHQMSRSAYKQRSKPKKRPNIHFSTLNSAVAERPPLSFGRTRARHRDNSFSDRLVNDRSEVQSFKLFGQSVAILVAISLLIFMSVATWKGATMTGSFGLEIFSMTLVTVILFILSYLSASYISVRNKSFVYLVIVLLVIALIKVFIILTYNIGPTSDYFNYHYFAYAKASGIPWTKHMIGTNMFFPHVLNIAMMYSIPYSLIGTNYVTSQILNIAITMFDGLLIYKLSASMINKQAGIFSALIFSLIPSYFMYSLINGAEPMYITFLLGICISFDTFLKRDAHDTNAKWVASFLSLAVLVILAYMVRPTIGIWVVAGFIYIIFMRTNEQYTNKFKLTRYFFFAAFALVFITFSVLSPKIYSAVYGIPIASSSSMNRYSLATGTSPETNGAYNKHIYDIMNKNYKEFPEQAKMDSMTNKDLNKRIDSNINELNGQNKWGIFLDQKYTQFSNEDYGYNWILYNTAKSNHHEGSFYSMKKSLVALSAIFYEFIVILCIFTMSFILLFAPRIPDSINTVNKLFYFSLLLDGFIIGSMIFEVQGRYHTVLYIPLVLILGLGVKLLTERNRKFQITLTI